MAIIVLVVASLALFVPDSALWIAPDWVNSLLMIVMFGMGLTLRYADFEEVLRRPKDVAIGCAAQFVVMPTLAFLLGKAFRLPPELLAGVALVGACPGGTSSNVVTYLAKGDLALSVAMTSVNTLLAPVLTPALAYLILRATIRVDVAAMFLAILEVVLAPVALGVVVNKFWSGAAAKAARVAPILSIAAICMIVASVVSHNAEKILTTGKIVFVVVILHNLLGYLAGFAIGKSLKLDPAKIKTLSIEVGMQNSGLATVLARQAFASAPLAAAPGAIFSVWHNISGAILAEIYKRWNPTSNETRETKENDER